MTRSASLLVLLLVLALVISCSSNRQLQSVSISPASAEAKNFPDGQVPFLATGMFSKPPSPAPLTSSDVTWCVGAGGVCAGNIITFVTVDQNGVAQCSQGASGTETVLAGTKSSTMMNPDGGVQLKVFGSAQITCP